MKVLFATSELTPLVRVGGLAYAAAGMAQALPDLGFVGPGEPAPFHHNAAVHYGVRRLMADPAEDQRRHGIGQGTGILQPVDIEQGQIRGPSGLDLPNPRESQQPGAVLHG